ncbi:universal stress protein [Nodosilinea sp. P-1105]|uniref:universal stress protein n=1 Tax=Nodosilinea sp. P-1105 TaxID=2546229 RepID=UPI00146C3D22|nr:universal stress protein [Nodosilinea sp. P-1105]NMF83179.1 universal stress protein [Nodosilinea sp. P-1105]
MFRRALICTDFTDGIYRLAQFAPSLAKGGFQSLIFFHNVPIETEREIPREEPEKLAEAKDQLTQLLREVPEDVEVVVEVLMGRPGDNIVRLAKQYQVDVIFLGTPTRTMLEEKLFGSTTTQLSEKSGVPLIILRPQLVATYTTEELSLRCRHLFRYLLLPYDGSPGSKVLVDYIRKQVQNNPNSVLERVRLLRVIDDTVRRELQGDHPMQEAQQELEQVQADLAALNLVVNINIVKGDPIQEIMAVAEKHDIGAIAICSSDGGGLFKWSAPSLAREVLRQSWHPVLYIPS